jgi:MFS family permease
MLMPCTLGVMLCSIHNYSLGVMIRPIEQEYGWTRAEISSGPFIIALIALIGAPLVGVAMDRFGARRIALPGVLFFCVTLALVSTATPSIWSWWILWVIVGISAMTVIPSIWTFAINSFFDANRGKALAIALSGTGIGAFLMPPLTNFLIDHHGWRGAYIGLALIMAAICFPLTLFFFRSAQDVHRTANAASGSKRTAPVALSGMTAREGFATLRFYQLAAATVIFSTAICGLTANQTPILIAQGLTPVRAAAVAGLMGIGSIIGRLAGGILLDKWDAKKVAAISVLAPCLNVGLLLAFPGSIEAAMAATFMLGLAIGTELDAVAYLAARHFGLRSLGTLYGTINGLMLFANGLAPMLANLVFDLTHSYRLYMWLVIPAFFGTAAIFLAMGKYPTFAPVEPPAEEPGIEPLGGAPIPART